MQPPRQVTPVIAGFMEESLNLQVPHRHITSVIFSRYPVRSIFILGAAPGKPGSWTAHRGITLNDKILKAMIIVGALVSLAGVMALPSALSGNKDPELLGTALAFFGMGAVLMALSFYLQARALRSQINADPNIIAALQAGKRKGTCDSCKAAGAVIQCTMHRVSLCPNCLAQHYDSRGCVYVPAVRKNARSRAGAAGRA